MPDQIGCSISHMTWMTWKHVMPAIQYANIHALTPAEEIAVFLPPNKLLKMYLIFMIVKL